MKENRVQFSRIYLKCGLDWKMICALDSSVYKLDIWKRIGYSLPRFTQNVPLIEKWSSHSIVPYKIIYLEENRLQFTMVYSKCGLDWKMFCALDSLNIKLDIWNRIGFSLAGFTQNVAWIEKWSVHSILPNIKLDIWKRIECSLLRLTKYMH